MIYLLYMENVSLHYFSRLLASRPGVYTFVHLFVWFDLVMVDL
jgi:hypothetical protein